MSDDFEIPIGFLSQLEERHTWQKDATEKQK